jgi:hypothetical protein
MRESIPVPADIFDPAVKLAWEISLEGECEVEFRRDAAARPLLMMEINPEGGWDDQEHCITRRPAS